MIRKKPWIPASASAGTTRKRWATAACRPYLRELLAGRAGPSQPICPSGGPGRPPIRLSKQDVSWERNGQGPVLLKRAGGFQKGPGSGGPLWPGPGKTHPKPFKPRAGGGATPPDTDLSSRQNHILTPGFNPVASRSIRESASTQQRKNRAKDGAEP